MQVSSKHGVHVFCGRIEEGLIRGRAGAFQQTASSDTAQDVNGAPRSSLQVTAPGTLSCEALLGQGNDQGALRAFGSRVEDPGRLS